MRTPRNALVVVALLTVFPEIGIAGIYNTAEPPMGPSVTKQGVEPIPFTHLRQDVLVDLLQLAVPQPEAPIRKNYIARRDALKVKGQRGVLTTEEQVNLSAYLLRLREYGEAIELLRSLAARERRNFMVYANLGTAYQLVGEGKQAQEYLLSARDVMPREWPGTSPEQLAWYRRAEEYHYKLVRLRNQEARAQAGGKMQPPDNLDDLFGVQFVGESGAYEAGKLAAAEQEKLAKHPDAVAIVQQLVIWLPDDTRLYWLLGELFNAQGDMAAAERIFEDCVWSRRFDASLLREHRQVLLEALPRPEPPPPPGEWAPSRSQLIGVVGAAGLLVSVLAYWQVREFRRRRSSVEPSGGRGP
jgi:tetratricopeptide (TPR) repeat protein